LLGSNSISIPFAKYIVPKHESSGKYRVFRAGPMTDPTGLAAAVPRSIIQAMRRLSTPHLTAPFAAWFLIVSTALAQTAPVGSAAARELLNSERIEATFGSYGIEVLESSPAVRVSNLYSRGASEPTCRTFAVVRYPDAVARGLERDHATIVAGGSIGAVFTASGWRVLKTHLHYGEMRAGARAATLMGVAAGTPLATHVYLLEVEKGGSKVAYATIAELHHPDYLAVGALEPIYGNADATGNESLLATMLEMAARKAAQPSNAE
jgi:hypothetical protein